MKILVAVKRVPNPGGPVFLAADGKMDASLARGVVNPYDEIALDVAYDLKEAGTAAEVVAVSVAPAAEASAWDEGLLAARARAADRAILVTMGEGEDRPEAVAVHIAEIARRESPDLILFGCRGADSDDGQTGPRIAGILGWPFLSAVSEVTVEKGTLRAMRQTDAGRETWEMPLPAVATCDLRGREARLISLYAIREARAKPVEHAEAGSLPSALVIPRAFGYAAPPARGACRMVSNVADLLDALSAARGDETVADKSPASLPDGGNATTHCYVGTKEEADALAWIAGRRELSLVNGVTDASFEDDTVRCRRGVHAGRFIETISVPSSRDVVIIVRGDGRTEEQRKQTDALLRSEPRPMPVRTAFEPHAPSNRPDMGEARAVVAGGRALRDAETFERLVGGLADALGGAAVAASGGAVNAGISPTHLLVGQTGRTIAPDLYIALGISGADQHVGGMRKARTIVAVNSDPHAPIFGVADFGLVGDLNAVVPEWIARLRA
jgi:electron transfer flavoprotein alpha subunit